MLEWIFCRLDMNGCSIVTRLMVLKRLLSVAVEEQPRRGLELVRHKTRPLSGPYSLVLMGDALSMLSLPCYITVVEVSKQEKRGIRKGKLGTFVHSG